MNLTRARLRLSNDDYSRLSDMLHSDLVTAILPEEEHKTWIDLLRESQIVPPDEAEPLVSMNDIVQLLDVDSGVQETFKLVFPEDADIRMGRLSVLAPVGKSLLGCRVGDGIVWDTPDRIRRLCVEVICRPDDQHVSRVAVNSDKCQVFVTKHASPGAATVTE